MRRIQVASEVDNALSDGMSQGFCMLVGHKGGDATARHSDIARIDLRRSAQSAVRRAFGKLAREGHVVPLGSSKISPGRDWWDRGEHWILDQRAVAARLSATRGSEQTVSEPHVSVLLARFDPY